MCIGGSFRGILRRWSLLRCLFRIVLLESFLLLPLFFLFSVVSLVMLFYVSRLERFRCFQIASYNFTERNQSGNLRRSTIYTVIRRNLLISCCQFIYFTNIRVPIVRTNLDINLFRLNQPDDSMQLHVEYNDRLGYNLGKSPTYTVVEENL